MLTCSFSVLLNNAPLPNVCPCPRGSSFSKYPTRPICTCMCRHDLVLIALADKPDWFLQMSPSGKVPMLLNEGAKLIESDLIMRFVDELRGADAQLLTVCGIDKFNETLVLTSKYYKAAHTILFKKAYSAEDEATFRSTCDELNKLIKGDYLAGDQLSLADFVLFPMLDRLEVIMNQLTTHAAPDHVVEWSAVEAETCDWSVLASYLLRMRQLPDVAAFRQPTRIQSMFAESMRLGAPNPDIV
ncbi:Glutathione dehydrogenase [Fasciolopsis buskii]|uniref:Glutathione dehydrogenase n=1 Tax=Fasciolopsis buskii TaxID=27845 RepID=A0A8E0RR66_9TREM|nr:Glutathione dehydrogenase [Fasciolopsis buski]